ncbi:copper resistance protein CopC [Micromonospora sp. LAH09]|uniref:copper resistance CopC family protein n=1 Tax=Micromonospora cabrerizensis TaxID=2911213 RepID=UPI001EE79589|nr:copper resistance protein CopC [Micromonospora cabrerizensis]MCG5468266.1 copper resistance protein CopC [Micromonospora cabrerizensis]
MIVTVALAAGLPLAVTAAPASAHGATHSITPAAGAALATAPAQVEVVFAAQITSDSTVAVIDRTGTDWADGPPVVHGATLRHRVRAGMPDGGYEIRWHVTFTDGHPVTGTAEFRVGARAAAAPNPFQARVSHGGVVAFQFAAGTAVFALLLAVMTLSRGVYAASKHESPREGSTL